MGVYIKGMEMPKRGHTITITIVGSGQAYVEYFDCRPHAEETIEYTAVPAPPHGRLGDLDKLRKRIEENIDAAKKAGSHEWWYACTVALDFALAAPAVIDAEEGE